MSPLSRTGARADDPDHEPPGSKDPGHEGPGCGGPGRGGPGRGSPGGSVGGRSPGDEAPDGGSSGGDDAGPQGGDPDLGDPPGFLAAMFPPWSRVVLVAIVVAALGLWAVSGWLRESRADRQGQALASQFAAQGASIEASQSAAAATASALASAVAALPPQDQELRQTALNYPRPTTPKGLYEQTPEGAVAAAQYFMELYRYTLITGKTERWEEFCANDSAFCNNTIKSSSEVHGPGGWVDPWDMSVTPQSWISDSNDTNVIGVTVTVESAAHKAHNIDGSVIDVPAESTSLIIQMRWDGSHWMCERVAEQ